MAHHAKIENGIVTSVIVTCDSDEDTFADRMLVETGEQWVRTSYNAQTNGFRGNFAGIGYTYDLDADAFYAPQPYPSWTLDDKYQWQPPVPLPGHDKIYMWDETLLNWIEVVPSQG
jgi:hypothetical protein